MNKDTIKGKWNEMKGALKERWSQLTDDDILHMEGSRDKLLGKLRKLYGYTKEKAQTELDNFFKKHEKKDNQEKKEPEA